MTRSSTERRSRFAWLGWMAACLALVVPSVTYAQEDSEVFTFDAEPDEGGETITDPELDDVPTVSEKHGACPVAPVDTQVLMQWHSRIGVDLKWEGEREEVLEATQIGLLELEHRASDSLRLAAGARLRHVFAMRASTEATNNPDRYALDLTPTALYADATIDEGAHLRLGYQVIDLGRFDVWNATNTLAVSDLRSGPTTMAEAIAVATPAARLDWDLGSWLALRLYYLPFFEPHKIHVMGTDYAMLPLAAGAEAEAALLALEGDVGRSFVPALSASGLRALGPEPSLAHPQGAARLTAHGSAGELALTASTALEKLPALYFSSDFELFVAGAASDAAVSADGSAPFDARFNRFATFSVDGATEIGPVQLGFETAYMLQRTLFAAQVGRLPQPDRTDMAQVGLRAEYLRDQELALAVEAFASYAMSEPDVDLPEGDGDNPLPPDSDREWLTMDYGRLWQGLAFIGQWAPPSLPIRFELAAIAFSGPTFFFRPRVEWEAAADLFLELGAYVVQGPLPTAFGSPSMALGTAYDSTDQVYTGLRWKL